MGTLPDFAFHATDPANWESIEREGLRAPSLAPTCAEALQWVHPPCIVLRCDLAGLDLEVRRIDRSGLRPNLISYELVVASGTIPPERLRRVRWVTDISYLR